MQKPGYRGAAEVDIGGGKPWLSAAALPAGAAAGSLLLEPSAIFQHRAQA